MTPDIADICDEVWHGTNGDELCTMSGCAGCHYVAGAAAALGLIEMAKMIAARERVKPSPHDPTIRGCRARHPKYSRTICSLLAEHGGSHQNINSKGSVRYSWPATP